MEEITYGALCISPNFCSSLQKKKRKETEAGDLSQVFCHTHALDIPWRLAFAKYTSVKINQYIELLALYEAGENPISPQL